MENLDQLRELIRTPRQCVILSHRNPDGDALGSCLGLSLFLQSLNHNVRVIFPSEYPVNFEWMPQTEEILAYDLEPGLVAEVIRKAELVFFLDFNSLDRIDKIAPLLEANQAPRVMIDHHIDPFPIADLMFSEVAASSTSEMVFNIIEKIQPGKLPGMLVMECLYTGIMTDTGSFRHATSERVFSILARFKSAGLNDTRIQELVNNSYPDKYLKLLGHCLHNRMELIPEQQFGLIWLTREDYRNFDIQRGDTEGIINYLMMLKTVKVGALVMNQPAIVKLSLRSKGDYSVQQICSRYFGGGGHRNASGGFCKCTLEETISRLKEAIAANPVPAVNTLS
ncbi:MAG: bifunctional oligoribonuclease/PAP phosphatase NrnA [Saprospiraceae bacterium]|jgi:phosphoesterase RecJ-like protein|nr:bifunctional oligoribonuclease/PAP phosphatase NrnA [Saprospiraceae bacterium]MBP9210851.1 bifunctional oligoribonuclease/PAP phosphatase NrnA [Saprospiraceae bacterium]MBV6471773.1 Bifunctional oligoribonuclease and PAP phosphatase NrnA [Saprospiraceae bacterium]